MSEERRSSRIKTPLFTAGQLSQKAAELLKTGYDKFLANDGSGGSASMDCQATLWFEIGFSQNVSEQGKLDGSTGRGHGHAEMDALHEFWVNKCGRNITIFARAYGKAIQCEAKPCCFRCSAVLGLLGIVALNSHTTRSTQSMGATEWSVTPDVADLLSRVCAVPKEVFAEFGSLSYS